MSYIESAEIIQIKYWNTLNNKTLVKLEDNISALGQQIKQYGLPAPDRTNILIPLEILRETSYDIDHLKEFVSKCSETARTGNSLLHSDS